ncbi:DUF692 family protein [Sphingomonas changnyeongensis]|uniref:DUF692 family protein n=1 Tax=Sphingomonas changnyeongensis TaxID=2698679 RepID=A0A7Z2NWV8_9SPHN|nr:DUF692 domain-containing protein [Sphingomonas changnyeongensis]QHL91237.1 DUF692 family protein [Sphingomonas changnyeongensis]
MDRPGQHPAPLRATPGIGLRLPHLALIARGDVDPLLPDGLWFEVHAENFMVPGGPRRAALIDIAARHPVSLHGVGLALAGTEPAPLPHLRRLARLCDDVGPVLVSDHLAWQRIGRWHVPDFLPFPRTRAALALTAANVDRAQQILGRRLLIENPSHYVAQADLPGDHDMPEHAFLAELADRTGCGLLIDVNNIHVSAHNLGLDAVALVDAVPAEAVAEIHVAGHSADPGGRLLIDSHDCPVASAVFALAERLLARTGPVPLLVERDADLPPLQPCWPRRRRFPRCWRRRAGPGRDTMRPEPVPAATARCPPQRRRPSRRGSRVFCRCPCPDALGDPQYRRAGRQRPRLPFTATMRWWQRRPRFRTIIPCCGR